MPALTAILAHPDDECLGVGGILAKYSAECVQTSLITATSGQAGRWFDGEERPSDEEVGRVREGELRAAAAELGVRDVSLLGYNDGRLDQVDPIEARDRIVRHLRRLRPDVVVTFAHDGAYGHPDHIAISQLTAAACVAAADPSLRLEPAADGDASAAGEAPSLSGSPHIVRKLYWFVTTPDHWELYQQTFKRLVSVVDGVERVANAWPEWSATTRVDAADHWRTVWRAIQHHRTQMSVYRNLDQLTERQHRTLWGEQWLYRVYSQVNGGRAREADLFDGLR